MLGFLTEKMQDLFSSLLGKGKLTEENIREATKDVRLALLEADVHYGVVKNFIKKVKEKALGESLFRSVSPAQQFIKIVHEELIALMGEKEASLNFSKKPSSILLCGLQGSGKTTQCIKLVHFLRKNKMAKNPLAVALDLQRPAAMEQLTILGKEANIPVFVQPRETDPLKVAESAMKVAREERHDVVVFDTAGRLHIDQELMEQLKRLKESVVPDEVLFVANAAMGQDAVNSAHQFNQQLGITGTILTMLDSDVRGGAAISIREVTGRPLKFEGVGEKVDDLQLFNPTSMADRILGMGDTINLVRKAKESFDEEEARRLEKKLKAASFTYEDYLRQVQMVKKMGSFRSLFKMLPGVSGSLLDSFDEEKFVKVEAIIQSMTPNERKEKCELSIPRRRRLAKGSGTTLDEVNRLVKSFKQAREAFKNIPHPKKLEKIMGGSRWR